MRVVTDPFTHALDQTGRLTHGHLRGNDHHGGTTSLGVNPTTFPQCHASKVVISGFLFNPGDFTSTGRERCIPTVAQGKSLTFVNNDAAPQATSTCSPPTPATSRRSSTASRPAASRAA